MIRAVVDPGVLVSAFIGRRDSVADRIVRAWRSGQVELVVSPALLGELSGVLARPKFACASRAGRGEDFVEALRVGATIVEDPPPERKSRGTRRTTTSCAWRGRRMRAHSSRAIAICSKPASRMLKS